MTLTDELEKGGQRGVKSGEGFNSGGEAGVGISPPEGYLQLALIDFGKAKDLRLASYPEHKHMHKQSNAHKHNDDAGMTANSIDLEHKHKHNNSGATVKVTSVDDPGHKHKHNDDAGMADNVINSVDPPGHHTDTDKDTVVMFVGNVAGDPT